MPLPVTNVTLLYKELVLQMNLKGMTGHFYKKINVLFENVQFQSDTNFAHPSQPKELIWRSEKKFERKLKWNV